MNKQTVYVPVQREPQFFEDWVLLMHGELDRDWKTTLDKKEGYFFTEQDLLDFAKKFSEYRDRFQREESRDVKKEQDRIGGMFSWRGATDEKICQDFLERKPIKTCMLPVESYWVYDEKDNLVHQMPETPLSNLKIEL